MYKKFKNIQTFEEHSTRFLTDNDYITKDNLEDTLKGDWAVFRISFGKKRYISSIYKENLRWNASTPKLSDPSTLKVTKDFATEIALINKEKYTKIGIADSSNNGLQEII